MDTNPNSHIERAVDQLFAEEGQTRRVLRQSNHRRRFRKGPRPNFSTKKASGYRITGSRWFATNGPTDAPLLPLSHGDVEDYRNARGLACIVGFYARSFSRQGYGRKRYDVCTHPSFDEFARGLMAVAMDSGVRELAKDETLKRRFPPCPLAGMTRSGFWATPDEYAELERQEAEHRRRVARTAVN